jgi:SOS-response transcriptional repressor LexA
MSRFGPVPDEKEYRHVLETIHEFIDDNGYPPTIQEMADLHNKAKTTMNYYLKQLEYYGYIERKRRIARGIRLSGS